MLPAGCCVHETLVMAVCITNKKLTLESLELGWLHADLLFTYKLVFG